MHYLCHTITPTMKHLLLSLLLLAASASPAWGQHTAKYGTLSYNTLLHAMPAYADAQRQLTTLKQKYEAEAQYNEMGFRRQFAEFLQGQKDFPQNILLKRQRDLQDAMERGLAFRHEADSLLRRAEDDLLKPVRTRLNEAIRAVGLERGYECIVNTDEPALPFTNPALTENATPYVEAKLAAQPGSAR